MLPSLNVAGVRFACGEKGACCVRICRSCVSPLGEDSGRPVRGVFLAEEIEERRRGVSGVVSGAVGLMRLTHAWNF